VSATVGAQDHIGIEHREQGVEVASPGGCHEGVHDPLLDREVGVRRWPGRLDPPPGPAGQLASRSRRPVDHGRDLVERQRKDVMKDEGQPLGGVSVSSTTSRPARPNRPA
jgi:hypothetical protein